MTQFPELSNLLFFTDYLLFLNIHLITTISFEIEAFEELIISLSSISCWSRMISSQNSSFFELHELIWTVRFILTGSLFCQVTHLVYRNRKSVSSILIEDRIDDFFRELVFEFRVNSVGNLHRLIYRSYLLE